MTTVEQGDRSNRRRTRESVWRAGLRSLRGHGQGIGRIARLPWAAVLLAGVLLLAAGCEKSEPVTGEAAFHAGEPLAEERAHDAPWIATKNMVRINTNDPVKAAVYVSRTVWPAETDNQRPNAVVLVPKEDWAVAMAAADLIHFPNNGPLLYLDADGIPNDTLAELKRLKPAGSPDNNGVQAIVVGKVSDDVLKELRGLDLKVDAIQGDDPARVASAIDAYYTRVSKEQPSSVIIASSEEADYAMPAVSWIAHMPEPVLYVSRQGIPQATADALAKRRKKAVMYVLGPKELIPEEVLEQLKAFGRVERIAADSPIELAIAFAKYYDPQTGFGWRIRTPGHNFSFVREGDEELAVIQAPFAHLGKHAPLLWTSGSKVPPQLQAYLESVRPRYKETPVEGPFNAAWLTGAEETVMPSVQSALDALLEIEPQSGTGHGGHGH
ncbi:cell wall-binding repeat-containing protein [Paenibacillus thiaminolyticus]|uniref:Cell wall-binding repeat-containing protein n=1 Tax=Paenibacillus thiaminolyticus TaxID=49283 RepID=A0AAP9DW98_PANTH|nr:ArsR family transcriptional regulator [Paenibacillus thiaminolyticus]MCY9534389.1 cell wall-binding repeat-containing protein [Paenibacillus thiaminolyticus]MCY9602917.1 cell wall-binding repeat-containing protein [Paenibacillus thiaminolyticus]MCY9608331.1 cell wall-binding repeat-containing protein [Paenibacillus thiaminolyticus]MCY9614384.1 cell wall-binding repeat-containing protein [Paenibacillus thiaminolyticus]MCY9618173.1 cell wall-binding repeat-containing protein [Paenibacillus th